MSSKNKKIMHEAMVVCDLVRALFYRSWFQQEQDTNIFVNAGTVNMVTGMGLESAESERKWSKWIHNTTGYHVTILTRAEEPEEAAMEGMGANNRFQKWDIVYSTMREVDGGYYHNSGRIVDMRTSELLGQVVSQPLMYRNMWTRHATRDGVKFTEFMIGFDNTRWALISKSK